MIQYTTLDVVLNYLPSAILKEYDSLQLKSWMLQFYRTKSNLPDQEKIACAVSVLDQHKAALPEGIKKIIDIRYQDGTIPESIQVDSKEILVDKLLIYQRMFFEIPYYINARVLRYIGQNKSPLIDKNLWCSNCADGFTVDSYISCLTTTMANGNILIIYSTQVENDSGDILIPDDTNLHQALALYVQSKYWNEKKYSHEANANNFEQNYMIRAGVAFEQYKGKRLQAGINPHLHNEFVFKRNIKPVR